MLSQTSGLLVDRIAGHLPHPLFGRMPRDACQGDTPGFQMQEEQNVVGNQAAPCQHLHREEVGASQHVHVPADELLPSSLLTPFRSRCEFRDVAGHCRRSDRKHDGRGWRERRRYGRSPIQSSLVAMRTMRASTARRNRGSARIRPTFGTVELLGNQPAVPGQDGIRKSDAMRPAEGLLRPSLLPISARVERSGSESRKRGGKMRPQDAILGNQVLILQQQALVHQAGHVCQQSHPFAISHA